MSAIILIDDQPIANFITRKLLQLEGVEENVKDFTNPVEAFQSLKTEDKPLIFLDLNMPEMSGWEFLDKMKEQNLKFDTVILTSSTSELDRQKAGDYDFVREYVTKPLTKSKFSELSVFVKDY